MPLAAITNSGSYAWVRGSAAEIDLVRGEPKCWPLNATTAYVPPDKIGTELPPDPPDPPDPETRRRR